MGTDGGGFPLVMSYNGHVVNMPIPLSDFDFPDQGDDVPAFRTSGSMTFTATIRPKCRTRKRLKKLLMSRGYARDVAAAIAELYMNGCGMSAGNAWLFLSLFSNA